MAFRKLSLIGALVTAVAYPDAGASPALAITKPACSATGQTIASGVRARVFVVKTGGVRRVFG